MNPGKIKEGSILLKSEISQLDKPKWSVIFSSRRQEIKDRVAEKLAGAFLISTTDALKLVRRTPLVLFEKLPQATAVKIKIFFRSLGAEMHLTQDEVMKRGCARAVWPRQPDLSFFDRPLDNSNAVSLSSANPERSTLLALGTGFENDSGIPRKPFTAVSSVEIERMAKEMGAVEAHLRDSGQPFAHCVEGWKESLRDMAELVEVLEENEKRLLSLFQDQKTKYETLETDYQQAQHQFQNDLQKMSDRSRGLESKIREMAEHHANLDQEKKVTEASLRDHAETLRAWQNQHDELVRKFNHLEETLQKEMALRGDLEKEKSSLGAKNLALAMIRDKLQLTLDHERGKEANLEAAYQKLRDEFNFLIQEHSEGARIWKVEERDLRQKVAGLASERADFEHLLNLRNEEMESLRQASAREKALSNGKFEAVILEIESLKKELDRQILENQTVEERNQKLETSRAGLEATLKREQEQGEALVLHLRDVKTELEKTQGDYQNLVYEANRLRKALETLQMQKTSLEKENSSQCDQVRCLGDENQDLRARLEKNQEEAADKQRGWGKKEAILNQKIALSERERQKLELELNTKNQELESLRYQFLVERDQHEKKLESVEKQLEWLEGNLLREAREKQAIFDQIRSYESKTAEMQKTLRDEQAESQRKIQDYEGRCASLANQLQMGIQEFEKKRQILEADRFQGEMTLKEVQSELAVWQGKARTLNEKLDAMNATRTELEGELDQKSYTLEDYEKRIQIFSKKMAQFEGAYLKAVKHQEEREGYWNARCAQWERDVGSLKASLLEESGRCLEVEKLGFKIEADRKKLAREFSEMRERNGNLNSELKGILIEYWEKRASDAGELKKLEAVCSALREEFLSLQEKYSSESAQSEKQYRETLGKSLEEIESLKLKIEIGKQKTRDLEKICGAMRGELEQQRLVLGKKRLS